MYAFWKYDKFPYLLWGDVVDGPDDDGLVQVKQYATRRRGEEGYGGGWFRPTWLLSTAGGKALAEGLQALKGERDEAVAAVDAEYRAKLAALVPSLDLVQP